MKKIVLLGVILMSLHFDVFSQSNWLSFKNEEGNFSFKLPSEPQRYDTLSLSIYIYTSEDATLSLQSYFVDSATILGNPEFSSLFSGFSGQDTLGNIVKIMLYLSEGELVSCKRIPPKGPNGIKGIEVGVKVVQDQTIPLFTFMRIYYQLGRYLVFSGSTNQRELRKNIPRINQFLASVKVN